MGTSFSNSPLSTMFPNAVNNFDREVTPQNNALGFLLGLLLSHSSNPTSALWGQQMVNNSIAGTSSPYQPVIIPTPDQTNPISNYLTLGFNSLSLIGSLIGGKAGTVLNQAGKIGSSIKLVKEANLAVKDGVAGAKTLRAGAWGATIGAASDLIGAFMPLKLEYDGAKGDLTLTLDSAYDGISDAAAAFGPVGMLVSGIMKGGSLLGKATNALGGGTDAMTSTDAILGSSFLNLTPLGLVNGFGGKKSDSFTKDNEAFALVGSSYTGSYKDANNALTKANKKYGLFSSNARKKANKQIAEALRQQNIISEIADNTQDRMNIKTAMSAINGNKYGWNMLGGYDLTAVRVGRHGMSLELLEKARSIIKAQLGAKALNPFLVYLQSLPENLRDSTNYRVRDYWEYNGRPKNFDEAKRKGMFVELEDYDDSGKYLGKSWHGFTVAKNPNTGEIEFMKSSTHPTIWKELNWYNSDDGAKFRSLYELVKTLPYYKYVKRKASIKQETPLHKNGGSIIELVKESIIELIDPAAIPEFLNGGSINVIPDGALHARKHNMKIEGITQKGIPVVSETPDGTVEQLAEIEKEEVILRLEVTQKLEKLQKKYYSEESSLKEKDEYALEAGKLITEEILHNTQDNAGLL